MDETSRVTRVGRDSRDRGHMTGVTVSVVEPVTEPEVAVDGRRARRQRRGDAARGNRRDGWIVARQPRSPESVMLAVVPSV